MNRPRPVELAGSFLRLGTTAFGGPAAHIAIMEQEFVQRRRWLDREEFLDMLGAVNLLPGPSSTEMAIFIGYRKAGWTGLLLAGGCFILPAMLMVGAIAWAYVRFGALPQFTGILYGIKPIIIVIVLQALWRLARTAVKSGWLAAIGLFAAGMSALGANPLAVLFGAGLAAAFQWYVENGDRQGSPPAAKAGAGPMPFPLLATAAGGAATAAPFGIVPLFLVFFKIGAVLFGSGYVLLAFLRADFVEHRHWLTESQLLDAVAVGQVTPGPVFTTATFIGYLLGGTPGALAATAGIFLPAFLLVAVSGPVVRRLRASPAAGSFLDGVNVASVALMAVVTWQLGRSGIADGLSAAMAVAGAALLFRFRVGTAWLVLGGAFAGLLARALGFHAAGAG